MKTATEKKKAAEKEHPYGTITPAVPDTKYFLTKEEFDKAVGSDFIQHANHALEVGEKFFVGLSHGQSPAGAYSYILEHYNELKHPENILYTFVNSPLASQRNIEGALHASEFIKKLFRAGYITRQQMIGDNFDRESIEAYASDFNQAVTAYLKENKKEGFDYVFLASDPTGRVAAIDRNSKIFNTRDIAVVVLTNRKEKEVTTTPYFLTRAQRIAFLATKADKRRPLAWLYAVDAKPDRSPGFLRYTPNVQQRMTVFIDDKALTWPQIEVKRETPYGASTIRIDTANPYNPNAQEKLPVIVLVHGFLGLNSYDGLLATIPTSKYIAAAMHYGSIPSDLPPARYSHHVARNIEAVVKFFGEKGHPVYLFDHSMGNIYFMMIDRELEEYPGIQKYLHGRIGANPFFGEEAKHAILGFLDTIILPALSFTNGLAAKTLLLTMRRVIPLDTKAGVRKRGIHLSDMLISKEGAMRDRIWAATKERILYLMANMNSLPHLNRIPIEQALKRLPAKVFAIQTHSALEQSKAFDKQEGLVNMPQHGIPVLIIKSDRDGVARYVPRIYEENENVHVMDVTNPQEEDLFREHLYHMVHPHRTTQIIDEFIRVAEKKF